MARNARYRWQNERRRGVLFPAPKQKRKRKPKGGITNAQAKYLAGLQRRLGEPYSGNGLTKAEASAAITDAKQRLDQRSRQRAA